MKARPEKTGLAPRFRRLCALAIALAAPCGFALNPAERPANYIVTRWDVEDGLPHNSARQICQELPFNPDIPTHEDPVG